MNLNSVRFGAAAYVDIKRFNWLEQQAVQDLVSQELGKAKTSTGWYGSGTHGHKGNTYETMVVKAPLKALQTAMARVGQILEAQTGQGLSVSYVKNEPNDRVIRTFENAISADGKYILA